MRRIPDSERRVRLGLRHRLSVPAATPVETARAVVALHATDPSTVYLSVLARHPAATPASIEQMLYDDRSVLRLHGMRRTLFVAPVEHVPAIGVTCGRVVAAQSRKTYLKVFAEAGVGDAAWLADLERATEAALRARGEATAAELSTDVPLLRTQVVVAPGKPYESKQTITAWVLFLLAAEGRIARGRPTSGSWTNTQWTWAPMEKWLPGGVPDVPEEAARADLARAWLAAYGPAPVSDLKWWTGWTLTQARQAVAAAGGVEVHLDEGVGHVLPDDVDPVAEQPPWIAVLPALDPATMGWAQRTWYLGEHTRDLFDTTGNAGPTIWCDGRVVGGWVQRPDGTIAHRLFTDVGVDAATAIEQRCGEVEAWLGDVRLAPRGRRRSPLETALLV
ncbi:MAG: winged helix DNA-binding domain-containing protein [Hamadaea sp.]|nr:winged helix DNA-binding domain-containing protein [Hamadaea sp.]